MKKNKANFNFVEELTVGEVAARSGVAVSAIHFYESKGLIRGRRTPGNRRRYAGEVLKRVVVIRAAQSVGIPLSFVRDVLMTLPREGAASDGDWREVLSRWRVDLDDRINRLTGLRRDLTYCIRCGCLLVDTCPLVAPLPETGTERAANILSGVRSKARSQDK